jgi:hypothetical protein
MEVVGMGGDDDYDDNAEDGGGDKGRDGNDCDYHGDDDDED